MSIMAIRRTRYAMVIFAVAAVAVILFLARAALTPFLLGGVLAYAMAPLVEKLARAMPFYRTRYELARTLSILLVYIAGLGSLILAGFLIIPGLIAEGSDFIDNIPRYSEEAQERFREWNRMYRERVPPEVQERINTFAQRFGQSIGSFASGALGGTFRVTRTLFSVMLGYIVIPFWLFYVLKDRHRIGPAIESWFPPAIRDDVGNCIEIVRRVLGSYIRAQLTLGLFVGTITTLGLFLLGVDGFIFLGLVAGLTELIPVIGPILGAIPALIVVLATDPAKFWFVLLFYVAVQQVENAILVPRIQGSAVQLHPALIIVLLVIAQQLAGFFGMLIVVPLAALCRDLFVYIHGRLKEQEAELIGAQQEVSPSSKSVS
jgi:predicted PurR-regulated permease PerM